MKNIKEKREFAQSLVAMYNADIGAFLDAEEEIYKISKESGSDITKEELREWLMAFMGVVRNIQKSA